MGWTKAFYKIIKTTAKERKKEETLAGRETVATRVLITR
jgi:hypothetical protein